MRTVFIDLDGTIASFCDDQDKVNMTEFPDGCFAYRQPVYPVIDAITDNFGNDKLVILSAVPHNQAIIEKHTWLDEHFPLKERHFIKWKQTSKADYIKGYCELNEIPLSDVILIDDEHKILSECETMGIQVYHISRLLTLGRARKR